VDVVIWTSDTYHYDLDHLSQAERELYKQTHSGDVPSAGPAFKQQVTSWLQDRYGIANVEPGKKAIVLKGNQHRRIHRHPGSHRKPAVLSLRLSG
jgi:hypothetical protein